MRSPFFSRLVLGAALCGLMVLPAASYAADAFAPIAAGDPIYRQLGALTLLGEGKPAKPSANLTRYEAALQVARVAAIASTKPEALSRSGWRALRDLAGSLKSELRQLGVDVEDVVATCGRQLDASAKTKPGTLLSPSVRTPGGKSAPLVAPPSRSFLNGTASPAEHGVEQSYIELPLSSKVRVDAVRSALQRDALDPFSSGPSSLLVRSNASTPQVGSDTSVAVDLNSWLRVRAGSSQRNFGMGDTSPALSAPLFQGASAARGLGGGLDVSPLKGVRVSTEVEQLSTNIGTSGLRLGGGIGLSAWQNRLTMSAHLSRLRPEDRAVLPSTATELNLGIGLSQRLSLSLLYQSLFSSQSESSRLAGGLNFSF